MAEKVLSKRAIAHIVEYAENDGTLSFNLMNFTEVEPYDALHKAMARVQGLVPGNSLVWRYDETSAVWSAHVLEYVLGTGRRVSFVRQARPTSVGF